MQVRITLELKLKSTHNLWVNYLQKWWVEFDDELTWLLTKSLRAFISFAENSQILLKISVIPIVLTFIYLVAVKQPTQLIIQLELII